MSGNNEQWTPNIDSSRRKGRVIVPAAGDTSAGQGAPSAQHTPSERAPAAPTSVATPSQETPSLRPVASEAGDLPPVSPARARGTRGRLGRLGGRAGQVGLVGILSYLFVTNVWLPEPNVPDADLGRSLRVAEGEPNSLDAGIVYGFSNRIIHNSSNEVVTGFGDGETPLMDVTGMDVLTKLRVRDGRLVIPETSRSIVNDWLSGLHLLNSDPAGVRDAGIAYCRANYAAATCQRYEAAMNQYLATHRQIPVDPGNPGYWRALVDQWVVDARVRLEELPEQQAKGRLAVLKKLTDGLGQAGCYRNNGLCR